MFCPSCGKEIPDHSSFCLGCGKAIHVVAQPAAPFPSSVPESAAPVSQASSFRPLTVLLLAVLGCVVWYAINANRGAGASGASRTPAASLLRPFSKPMLSGSVAVSPQQVRYWTFVVTPTMTNAHVAGSFHASGGAGNDIEAIVAESGECENWINGHHGEALYMSGKVTNGALDVPISQAGTYCLAFSNKMGLISGKTVSGSVALQYLLPVSAGAARGSGRQQHGPTICA